MCDNRAPAALYHCYTLLHLSLALTKSFALPPAHPGQGRRLPGKKEWGRNPMPRYRNDRALSNLTEDQPDAPRGLRIYTACPAPTRREGKEERGGFPGLPAT